MSLDNVDLTNKTPREFARMVAKLMQNITEFVERGERELDIEVPLLVVSHVFDEGEQKGGTEVLMGREEEFMKIVASSDAIQAISNMYTVQEIKSIFDKMDED